MSYIVQSFFAGAWSMVWHWGVGVGLIICLLAAAWFFPIFKLHFFYAALIVVVALFFQWVGIQDEKQRVAAQQALVHKEVNRVIESTKTEKSRKAKDKYDKPTN